jgi:hypothetical protein
MATSVHIHHGKRIFSAINCASAAAAAWSLHAPQTRIRPPSIR